MVRVLLLLTLFFTACSEEKICDMEFPTMCHTKAEWKAISDNNWKAIECMEKYDQWLIKNDKKRPSEDRLKKIYQHCGVKEVGRVEFK
jgi:hypothetical protein